MAKILIIGNSAAGFSACQALIRLGANEITVVALEDTPCYYKPKLLDYLSSAVKKKEILLCGQDFYQKNNINFLKSSEITKLDPKKQRVSLKDNTKISYDYLIIASGQRQERASLPGKNKEGVLVFNTLEDANAIKDRLLIANTISVIGEPSLSFRLAEIFSALGKEVKVISVEAALPESLQVSGKVELISGLTAQEFIGDGAQLQALKLNSGKVIGTDMLIFTGFYTPCTAFLKETQIKMENGYILVDNAMRTNLFNIFACGSVCKNTTDMNPQKSWDQALLEGNLAAEEVFQLIERSKMLCRMS